MVMGFDGDLNQVTPTDDHKENLKRSALFHRCMMSCHSILYVLCILHDYLLQRGDEDPPKPIQG